MPKRPSYLVRNADTMPSLRGIWDETAWIAADVITLENFKARSSDHRPKVEAKSIYTQEGLFIFFRVFDRYVRAVRTEYQSNVYKDSCVEFFVEPLPGRGYFNFEINCAGAMLLYFIEDPTRTPEGDFLKWKPVPAETGELVRIYHSLPGKVEHEINENIEWKIEYFIPFKVFESCLGAMGSPKGRTWRANFYKCADDTSHPHWGSWAPLTESSSFHSPEHFAPLLFE